MYCTSIVIDEEIVFLKFDFARDPNLKIFASEPFFLFVIKENVNFAELDNNNNLYFPPVLSLKQALYCKNG